MISKIREAAFRLRWLFLPPEAKYAYLWNRTKALNESGYYGYRKY